MDQIRNLGDQRQQEFCVHCGGATETRDHAPSKILLDKPYPTNLPVVPPCSDCNERFSLDEQYVACFVECVLHGSTKPSELSRDKIAKILSESPRLRARLERSRKEGVTIGGEAIVEWRAEESRIRNVILKLARCHAAFELNEPKLQEPDQCMISQLANMNEEQRDHFEEKPDAEVSPEIGSRAMQRLIIAGQLYLGGWLDVQAGRYRYMTIGEGSVMVRGVLSEHLAFEVIWEA